ncbi:MAG: SDR family NAD(P)-dependent oxidoreductase, partial [Anaerostipes sp.]
MNESWLGLNGKTVIVTGGASGIGKAVAQEFLNVGCNVVVSDMAPEAPEVDTAAGRFHYVKTDVTSAKEVDAMAKEVVDTFGTVDVLVNNAGINIPRLLVDPKEPKG